MIFPFYYNVFKSHLLQIHHNVSASRKGLINPFPYTNALLHLYSKQLLKTLKQKEKLHVMRKFLLLPKCFQLYSIMLLSFTEAL